MDRNLFEIRLQGEDIYYYSKNNIKGNKWRLAVWWSGSSTRIAIL